MSLRRTFSFTASLAALGVAAEESALRMHAAAIAACPGLVYWAGGNAFHHHQDINRLCEAWRRPETVVVHEQYWTAQAKFSDIVLPATTSLEREDIGSGGHDGFMIAMSAQIPPVGEARDDSPSSAISPNGWGSN